MTYHITTPQQLQDIDNDLQGDYILDNDLDMTGFNFSPIGSNGSAGFEGTFDGQNFTIRNLTVDDSGLTFGWAGLFAYTDWDMLPTGPTISNLKLDNITILGSWGDDGALIGYARFVTVTNVVATNVSIYLDGSQGGAYGVGGLIGEDARESVFLNCSVSGEIISDDGDCESFGGFIGSTSTTTITNCHSNMDINLTIISNDKDFYDIGGFIGFADVIEIYNCYSNGVILCTGVGPDNGDFFGIGGFAGGDESVLIHKCYSECSVECVNGISYSVGGFSGDCSSKDKHDCYCNGDVLIDSNGESFGTGGFAGELNLIFDMGFITNCYSSGDVTYTGNADWGTGGFCGATNYETIENCYSVGTVLSNGGSGSILGGWSGGFIGSMEGSGASVSELINCSWYTGSHDHAIGVIGANTAIPVPNWDTGQTINTGDYRNFGSEIWKSIWPSPFITTNLPLEYANGYWEHSTQPYDDTREYDIPTLAEKSFGTDESDNTLFYHKEHAVYAQ